jgi:NAD(P)-dependent dehydrogenase (short-subunit alcohol dehydrogenase family)
MKRAVLITGAKGGIGQVLCSEFRRVGYFVIATDLKQAEKEVDCDHFINFDIQKLCGEINLRKPFFEEIETVCKSSDAKIASIINNAAIQILNSTSDISVDDWSTTLQTNLIAPFMLIQGLLSSLKSNKGSVVNIASVHASLTKPNFVCYATSKSALVGMTRSLAIDLGSSIRVNSICPTATDTTMLSEGFKGQQLQLDKLGAMHPIGRITQPEEVAYLALFLCSDQSKCITGACFNIDGGISGRLHDPL